MLNEIITFNNSYLNSVLRSKIFRKFLEKLRSSFFISSSVHIFFILIL